MKRPFFSISIFLFANLLLIGCKQSDGKVKTYLIEVKNHSLGVIERYSPEMDALFAPDAEIEILGRNMSWAEGPLWIPGKKWLLCSDVKENRIYRWSEQEGFKLYLENSGFTGDTTDSRERGSNGLTIDAEGRLVLCQHGNRQVARMLAPLDSPKPNFEVLASSFEGWKLNSPNDLVYDSKGNLYFTDPPFGLNESLENDPKKELTFQGIFRLGTSGKLSLVTKDIDRPNGLAFSPNEDKLYVSNTDGNNAKWFSITLNNDGQAVKINAFHDATEFIGKEIGYPDGIKVDLKGNIYTAGPGGLWIFNNKYELIGKIKPNEWVSNCAFDDTYENLFITADSYLLRVRLKNKN